MSDTRGHLRRVKVEALDQLRIMAQQPVDIEIRLGRESALGDEVALTGKRIQYQRSGSGRDWWLWEAISATERYYTEPQLARDTSIVRAIENGALYVQLER